jgi:hypothetical protein
MLWSISIGNVSEENTYRVEKCISPRGYLCNWTKGASSQLPTCVGKAMCPGHVVPDRGYSRTLSGTRQRGFTWITPCITLSELWGFAVWVLSR